MRDWKIPLNTKGAMREMELSSVHRAANGDLAGTARAQFEPAKVMQLDLSQQIPSLQAEPYKRYWILVRLYGEPIGTIFVELDDARTLAPQALTQLIWARNEPAIVARFEQRGLPKPLTLPVTGFSQDLAQQLTPTVPADSSLSRPASVVVCTQGQRPESLKNCLASIDGQHLPPFEVIVVDNDPSTSGVAHLVGGVKGSLTYRYIAEPRPGLSWARNAGVEAAVGDIIAFLDDDDEADPDWLLRVIAGFDSYPDVGCVTGAVLPARIDTRAQELFESIGGHNKGVAFCRRRFTCEGPQSPLFPLPPFGVGANMAFTRLALRSIGGFDVGLGAGTPTFAGEDTLAMTLTLLSGFSIAYEPGALVWHLHRRKIEELESQLHGYSIGLTAYYAALLRHRPRSIFGLIRLLPSASAYFRALRSEQALHTIEGSSLNRRRLLAMLLGPCAYLGSCRRQRIVKASLPRTAEDQIPCAELSDAAPSLSSRRSKMEDPRQSRSGHRLPVSGPRS